MILAESVEHEEEEEESYGALGEAPDAPETVEILDKWCADLTRQARDGEIDPVIGREAELRRDRHFAAPSAEQPDFGGRSRGRQNGGGGSAGLQDSPGQVPPLLQGARLLSLDLGRMQAGASMRANSNRA